MMQARVSTMIKHKVFLERHLFQGRLDSGLDLIELRFIYAINVAISREQTDKEKHCNVSVK